MSNLYEGRPPVDPNEGERNLPDARTALDYMLRVMLTEGGSDLHLQADEPPRYRKDGDLIHIPNPNDASQSIGSLTRPATVRIVEILANGDHLGRFERADARAVERIERTTAATQRRVEVIERYRAAGVDVDSDPAGFDLDTSYEFGNVARFRVNISLEQGNPRVVMRKIPTKILTMEDLNLPESLYELATYHRGLVLVTGPTGSGKSTTLAAIINQINETRACSILTVEDPVEFVHRSKTAMVSQREVGEDTASFHEALRRALRQDPDVILVGEMRDIETMRIAIEAADTGHLVFGTMHTKSAKDTLTRMVNSYPAEEQEQIKQTLTGSLVAVVGQTLIKKPKGGRVAALEIMKVNAPIRAQLQSKSGFLQIEDSIRSSPEIGNKLLDDHLYELVVNERVIHQNDAVQVASNRKALIELLKSAGYGPTN